MRLTKYAVTGLLLCAGVAQATTLVVRASGPSAASYPPGKALPDTARIVLKTNDQIILLDQRGTRTLRGPGNFSAMSTASADTTTTDTALAALTQQRGDRRVRIGAVRTLNSTETRPGSVWYVDASKPGNVCIADPGHALVWRPGSNVDGTITISSAAGTSAKLDWISGQAVQPWPTSLPLTSGARYKLAGAGTPVDIKVVTIATPTEDYQAMAKTLIANGCSAQVDLLIAKIDDEQKAKAAN